ncbi:MAG: DAK2 domain-containing protein [Bacillaceae bacterium]|nr:DAK2 domain-containing protein [Bacillaceae bacterium]
MEHKHINADLFRQMIYAGAARLHQNVEKVDALNVFPVPDGDTGTNMNLSFASGVEELKKTTTGHVGEAAKALSRGILMGARGNSGVILSQLFRGFSRAVKEQKEISARQFAEALQEGVETAYKAVMKPVEGTILTVARESAEAARAFVSKSDDLVLVMEKTLEEAQKSLQKTPELLPVLREVGVVDSGGQGLVYIYEGFLACLKGEETDWDTLTDMKSPSEQDDPLADMVEQVHAQTMLDMDAGDIEYGYCTEFMIHLGYGPGEYVEFDEHKFREELSRIGDSLLVVSDDELVKIHIHAEHPGEALNLAQQYGSLQKIKIENMREQYETIVDREQKKQPQTPATKPESAQDENPVPVKTVPYGIIAVVAGKGIAEIFQSLGVDKIVEGGQTMNPSTEDIVAVARELNAENIIILPNNNNIVMAAEQAADLLDVPAVVIPSKTVPQGISAMLAFKSDLDPEANQAAMEDAMSLVKTGQITHAVRDTTIDDLDIKEGDYIGIADGQILSTSAEITETARQLLSKMIEEEDEILTIITGDDAEEGMVSELTEWLETEYPYLEVESRFGGQPLYPFIFSIE